jgi:ABC-type sugar transport system permease subunit
MFYGLPLVLYIVFFLLPFGSSLLLSFTSWDGFVKTISFIGIRNYLELFRDERFYSSLFNTVEMTVLYTVAVNTVAMLFAVLVDGTRLLKGVFKVSFFIPNILAPIIIGFVWTFMLNYNFGIVNVLLRLTGLNALVGDWIGSPAIVRFSVATVFVWQGMGFFFVVYLAALQGIPQEMIEASRMDGARGLRMFFNITLPSLAGAVTVCLTLSLIGGIKLFDLVFALTYGGPGFSSETMTLYIYNTGFISNRNGYGSAVSVVMFLFILLLTVLQLRFLRPREDAA